MMAKSQDLSYEEIVHHIVSDKPVPNVVQVPDITLSDALRTESEMRPRPKPWENGVMIENRISEERIEDKLVIDLGPPGELQTTSLSQGFEDLSRYYAREAEFDELLLRNQDEDDKA